VKRRRDLIVTNVIALLVLLAVWLVGWWEAAAFGVAVLVLLDLMVLIREQQARSDHEAETNDENG
jgi:hypothetical protein